MLSPLPRALRIVLVSALVFGSTASAISVATFFDDFDNAIPPQFTGAGNLRSVDGFAGLGPAGRQFGGNLLQNASGFELGDRPPRHTVFTLTGLPAHSSVSVNFLLGVMNTWDRNIDWLDITANGTTVFRHTFDFISQSPPTYTTGLLTTRKLTTGDWTDYGFDNSWGDSAYDMALEAAFQNIPHSTSSLTMEFFTENGFQGGTNESFGIDNFEVVLNGVPEPALGLPALSGALLAVTGRRSKRASL